MAVWRDRRAALGLALISRRFLRLVVRRSLRIAQSMSPRDAIEPCGNVFLERDSVGRDWGLWRFECVSERQSSTTYRFRPRKPPSGMGWTMRDGDRDRRRGHRLRRQRASPCFGAAIRLWCLCLRSHWDDGHDKRRLQSERKAALARLLRGSARRLQRCSLARS
jgi:hypothetical protein